MPGEGRGDRQVNEAQSSRRLSIVLFTFAVYEASKRVSGGATFGAAAPPTHDMTLLSAPLAQLKSARAKVNQEDKELAAALHVRDVAVIAASEAMVEALQLARAVARLADKDALFDGLRATAASTGAPAGEEVPADPVAPTPPTD